MTSKLLFAVLSISILSRSIDGAERYYVDNRPGYGHDQDNDGKYPVNVGTKGPFATIQKAANEVMEGDTVYVMRTDTPYSKFKVSNKSGTESNPIRFIGYNSLGANWESDLNGGTGVPSNYSDIQQPSGLPAATVDASPLITGGGRAAGQNAIELFDSEYVYVENFWVKDAGIGFYVTGPLSTNYGARSCKAINLYVWNTGDTSSYNGRGIQFTGASFVQQGTPVVMKTTGNEATNCVCYNTGQQAFTILHGDNNKISDCRAYTDDSLKTAGQSFAAIHYFFVIENGNENSITDCKAERLIDTRTTPHTRIAHGGHGFVLQVDTSKDATLAEHSCDDNEILDCETKDIWDVILMRGQVTNTQIADFESNVDNEEQTTTITTYTNPAKIRRTATGGSLGQIRLSGGAEGNDFSRVKLYNSDYAIMIQDNEKWGSEATAAAKDNSFDNCVFECETAIVLSDRWLDEEPSPGEIVDDIDDLSNGSFRAIEGNWFLNCTFVGDHSEQGDNIFIEAGRENSGNKIYNCVIIGFDHFSAASTRFKNLSHSPTNLGFEFRYNCFWNFLESGHPSDFPSNGTNSNGLIVDDSIADPAFGSFWYQQGEYGVIGGSGCVDGGWSIVNPLYNYDVTGDPNRTDGLPDIGAYED